MMTKLYYFGGWFTTRAFATLETDESMTPEQLDEYVKDNLYDLDWEWGHKGEITDAQFEEVEEV